MMEWKRLGRLLWGLLLCGVGIYLELRANIGLSPWDAFAEGVSFRTGMLFGDAVAVTSAVVLVLDLVLREPIGVGTILNAVLIGKFVDVLEWLDLLPVCQSMLTGVPVLLLGQLAICVGSYYYIGAAMGCGPRDSLMISIGKHWPRIPIGLARFCVECTVLVAGWLLGAPVGVGTVLFMFGISFLLQFVFRLYRFDAKALVHEDAAATLRRWLGQPARHA